jgi:quercetin dioxygenase-like cupin family protein
MQKIQITQIESAPKVPFRFDGRIMYSSEMLEVIHLTLPPGDKMEPHTQPFDVVFFVIEGTGKLQIEDETIEGNPGTCIRVPAGRLRSWNNNGNGDFRVLVIKDLK